MTLIERLKLIDRVDSLIRRKNTGSPKELSARLNLSERSIYNLIDQMKALGAPISYCNSSRSYEYEEPIEFRIGFESPKTSQREINGGVRKTSFLFSQHTLTFKMDFSIKKKHFVS